MSVLLNPYVTFPGTAREAMEFYQSVLGGELRISTFGEFGAPEGVNPEGVMHAALEAGPTFVLFASDNAPGMPSTAGDNISISLSGPTADAEAMTGYFNGLAAGGTVTLPLEPQMWGDTFGMLVDKYGIHWMVNIGADA